MRKKHCIGFFVVILLLMFCLETGYQWSYQKAAGKMEEKRQATESMESLEETLAARGNAKKISEYLLKELNGYVIVYLGDEKTVYEVTEIAVEELPDEVKTQILEGMRIESTDELYAFLENYSS